MLLLPVVLLLLVLVLLQLLCRAALWLLLRHWLLLLWLWLLRWPWRCPPPPRRLLLSLLLVLVLPLLSFLLLRPQLGLLFCHGLVICHAGFQLKNLHGGVSSSQTGMSMAHDGTTRWALGRQAAGAWAGS